MVDPAPWDKFGVIRRAWSSLETEISGSSPVLRDGQVLVTYSTCCACYANFPTTRQRL